MEIFLLCFTEETKSSVEWNETEYSFLGDKPIREPKLNLDRFEQVKSGLQIWNELVMEAKSNISSEAGVCGSSCDDTHTDHL